MAIEHRWDIIRDNELLRRLLSSKMDEKNLSTVDMERLTGLSRQQINGYFKKNRVTLSQWGVVKLANELGFEIKLDIAVKAPVQGKIYSI
jgi:hypothetical protein